MDDEFALPTPGNGGMNWILSSDTNSQKKPFLTEDLPGTGGVFKEIPEDFVVEEIPAFPFSGSGEHLIVLVEKRGLTTYAMAEILARSFGISQGQVGFAGLKDAFAVSRQYFSLQVPEQAPPLPRSPLPPGVSIISQTRHTHKLRAGMLSGNSFKIRIRDCVAPENAEETLAVLLKKGLPNYYGSQRFGSGRQVSFQVGLCLLNSDFLGASVSYLSIPGKNEKEDILNARLLAKEGRFSEAKGAFPQECRYERRLAHLLSEKVAPKKAFFSSFPYQLPRLFVSAVQSEIFNRILSLRISSIDHFLPGDIGMFSKGAVFFRNALPNDPRLETFEVSPSGLLFGKKAPIADGPAGEIEQGVLSSCGGIPSETEISKSAKILRFSLDGARRRLRERISGLSFSIEQPKDLLISFSLPKGTYATEVLREVIKPRE